MDDADREAKNVLAIIAKARNYTETRSFNELFLDAESIISALAYLVGPLMDRETLYREIIVNFMALGDSHAKAEAKAKASKEYAHWKKLERVYNLAEEQIKLLKKFKGELESEYNRS